MKVEVVADNISNGLGVSSGPRSTAVDGVCNLSQFVCHTIGYVSPENKINVIQINKMI